MLTSAWKNTTPVAKCCTLGIFQGVYLHCGQEDQDVVVTLWTGVKLLGSDPGSAPYGVGVGAAFATVLAALFLSFASCKMGRMIGFTR